jgi:hypothetical protein
MTAPGYADFAARIDTSFLLTHGDGTTSRVQLVGCEQAPAAVGLSSYSLTFSGGADGPAEQGTFLLRADGFDEFAIFLVPVRQGREGMDYQAVFTQLHES